MTKNTTFSFANFWSMPQEVLRLGGLSFFVLLAFCTLTARLWQLQMPRSNHAPCAHTQLQQVPTAEEPTRLFDRNGLLIAGNVRTFSIYANARLVVNPEQTARALCACFKDLDFHTIQKRLSLDKGFVWIKRHITPQQKKRFLQKGLCGVYLQKDSKRVYPQKALFSHTLGLRDIDGKALCGLEKFTDAKRATKALQTMHTSLDSKAQHLIRQALLEAIAFYKAEAGNALLLHIPTREIRAMVSLPDYDPNAPIKTAGKNFFNRNVMGVYEFGSVLKIHNITMGLEEGIANVNSIFDATHPLRVGRFTIRDFGAKKRPLTLREAFLYSSNIVNAKLALNAGASLQQDFFKRMGFFDRIRLELPESATPLIPSLWRQATLITASYGYGLSITPLHLAQSVASIVSGYWRPLTLRKTTKLPPAKQVVHPKTARLIRQLLQQSVHKGQSKNVALKGYDIGAKTGTSNMLQGGHYRDGRNLVSCVSIFPTKNPEYVLLVSLEHPKASAATHGFTTAGWIAAPTTKAILKKLLPLMGFLPTKT